MSVSLTFHRPPQPFKARNRVGVADVRHAEDKSNLGVVCFGFMDRRLFCCLRAFPRHDVAPPFTLQNQVVFCLGSENRGKV